VHGALIRVDEPADALPVSLGTGGRQPDVVDYDDYSPTLAEHLAARPSDESPLEMIRHALTQSQVDMEPGEREVIRARMGLVLSTPALQARAWAHKTADELLLAQALAAQPGHDAGALETKVIAAAAAVQQLSHLYSRLLTCTYVVRSCCRFVRLYAMGSGRVSVPDTCAHPARWP
jgi:hypothetical protein